MNKEETLSREFVPYDLSLRLKNVGFNEPCLLVFYGEPMNNYYPRQDKEESYIHNGFFRAKNSDLQLDNDNYKSTEGQVTRPTWQSAFAWFNNHGLHSFVDIYPTEEHPERCWFMIRYMERGVDGNEDYMSGWYLNLDDVNAGRLKKLLDIVEITHKI